MSFKQKVVLITGASSGIGAACAEYFAKEGALLSLIGRNAEKFKNVVKRIKDSGVTNDPQIILADVTTDYKRIMDEVIARNNKLDVLINNAGFTIRGTIENVKIEDYDAIMATNVRSVLLLSQLAVPHLIESKGNIVNVSSVAGLRASVNNLSYSMSKAALDHFTRCAALELAGKGVRVNAVNPALIVTDFHLNLGYTPENYAKFVQEVGKLHPIGRVGQPDEVVSAIAFLARENAGFLTGMCMTVDGGLAIAGPALPNTG